MIEIINIAANFLKGIFFGDYWFIFLPLALTPIMVLVVLEIRRTIFLIRKQRKIKKA